MRHLDLPDKLREFKLYLRLLVRASSDPDQVVLAEPVDHPLLKTLISHAVLKSYMELYTDLLYENY